MKTKLMVSMLFLALAACREQPAETAPPAEVSPAAQATQAQAPPEAQGFRQQFELHGVGFLVEATNSGSLNTLTITPSGLAAGNQAITREIDGSMTGAEVLDLNQDQLPELYVWANSAGSGSYGTVMGWTVGGDRALVEIAFPPLDQDPVNSQGYMGHDAFAVSEGRVIRRFPLYAEDDANASPSGKTRELQYELTQGEQGWAMRVASVAES